MAKAVAVLVGSLRRASYSRKIAEILLALSSSSLTLSITEIGDLLLYNEDIDGESPPESYTRFRQTISTCSGVIFVSPEYNRSVPAVLKNAIDIGSRPYGKNVWDKKPAAVITVSPGAMGGFGANQIIRQSLVVLNMITLCQPEAYLGEIDKALAADGKLNERTGHALQCFIHAYADFIAKLI